MNMNMNINPNTIFVLSSQENQRQVASPPTVRANYYAISCIESTRKTTVKYNFQGRVNEPNMTYASRDSMYGNVTLGYQAVELTLCPTVETFSEFPFLNSSYSNHDVQGAIVITHRPLTNGPPLYSCFFLSSNSSSNKTKQLDKTKQLEELFQFRDSMKQSYQLEPIYVRMNDFIGGGGPVQAIETVHRGQPCIVVYYPEPIPIQFPKMKLVGGSCTSCSSIGAKSKSNENPHRILYEEGFQEGMSTQTFSGKFANMTPNGNPDQKYGKTTNGTSCLAATTNAGRAPDLANLPKINTTFNGDPVKKVAGAKLPKSGGCAEFQQNLDSIIDDKAQLQQFMDDLFQFRKNNDGFNPFYGNVSDMDCYQDYVDNIWGGEQNFLNYLIQKGVNVYPLFNYWNPSMAGNGFDVASIGYNLDGKCYDSVTVSYNVGRAEQSGYNYLSEIGQTIVSDASYVTNTMYSGVSSFGKTSLDYLQGGGAGGSCDKTPGPQISFTVPILDSPDVTYQECTMIPSDETEIEQVFLTSQTKYFDQYNSLVGIIFYFIFFLIIYFGTPFMYFFVMCNLLKHGYSYSGASTFADYLRKPQNIFGMGKSRGISVLFNIVYWIIVLLVFLCTYIPGANIQQSNTVVILMMIAWVIGYIGVKNNPPPESCFY
jgi:hypothetical protein